MSSDHVDYVREGYLFYTGTQGHLKDYQKAYEYFSKGVEAGDSNAMNSMGVLYLNGHGVPKDPRTAISWFLKALEANENNFYACKNLGNIYENGTYVKRDVQTALRFYEHVIEESINHAPPYGDCCYSAGLLYLHDLKQYDVAESRFAKARTCRDVVGASAGIAYMCEKNLLSRYRTVGREERRKTAFSLYMEDAKKGDPFAMDCVARIYCEIGGFQQAVPWLEKAAALDYAPAKERLRNVRAHIRFTR